MPRTKKNPGTEPAKQPLDIDKALYLIDETVRPYPKAAMFELAELGYSKPFEQLIACIISIRTFDEVSLPAARRLLERARTPADMDGWGERDALLINIF
jgi:endonuclease-3